MSGTAAGNVYINVKANTDPFQKSMKSLAGPAEKMAASIGKKISGALAVASIAKFGKECIDAGASLNAMGTIIDAALPNMTKQVDDFAEAAGSAFGLSETQAKGFVGKFASMAHAMGYTEKQAYDMSTSLAGLAGDIASYYHISQDEAFGKLGAVFTGETESLKSLGVVMTQNALQSFAMSQGIQKSWSEMSELEKTSLRYQFILQSLSLAQGDFAKYSNTWSGSLATIKLNWQNFMATVGQGLINILLPLIQVIAKLSAVLTWLGNKFLWLTRLITGKDAEVGTSLNNTFGSGTQDMFNDTGVSLGNVGSGLKGVGGNAKKAKKEIQALQREMMGFDKITKLTGKADTSTGTTGASGAGGGGGGVGGVGDLGDLESLNDLIDGLAIPQETTDSWDGWKKVVADALDLILSAGKLVIDDVLSPLIGLATKHIAPLAIDLIGTALKNIVDLVTGFPKWLLDLFSNGDKTVTIDVDDKFSDKWKEIQKLSDTAVDVGINLTKGFTDNTVADWLVNKGFMGSPKAFVGLDRGFVGTVADWLENNNYIGTVTLSVSLKSTFSNGAITVVDWIIKSALLGGSVPLGIELVSNFGKSVAVWISNNKLIGGITNGFGKLVNGVINFGVSISSLSWNSIKSKWAKLKKKFRISTKVKIQLPSWARELKGKWNNLLGKFKGKDVKMGLTFTAAAANLKAWINSNVIGPANSALHKIPILQNVSIPYLAQGGFVKANTPQLAMIGDNKHYGEITAPEPKLQAMADRAAGAGNAEVIALLKQLISVVQNKDTDVYLDGEKIKNNTVSRINRHTKRTGQLEIII